MDERKYIESYCTGCGLCHSVQYTKIAKDKRGFPSAVLQDDEKLSFYRNVCPVYYYDDIAKHDVWGIVKTAIVGYSSDDKLRYKAASGGALTELCCALLSSKTVDGILQTTYDPDDQTKTISVISRTEEEVKSRCGSRYSISVPLEHILQSIVSCERYAFVGKPCDVMALKRYFSVRPELEKTIPYLLSFFCAGEPSEAAQDALLNKMNCTHEECDSITYRGNGWPGYTTVVKKNGTVEKLEYKVTWGRYLGRDLRNICRFCMDGTGDCADIVCADFWHLDEKGYTDFSEHEGRNIIIARTNQGVELLNQAIRNNQIIVEEDFTSKMDEFHKYQPAQYKRKGTMKSALFSMRLFGKEIPHYSKSYLNKYGRHISPKEKLKYFIGITKRVIKGKV